MKASSPPKGGTYRLRFGSMKVEEFAPGITDSLASLPDHAAAVLDLCGASVLDVDSARALRRAISEASRRGVTLVIAANEADARLPLVKMDIERVCPIARDLSDADALLDRMVSI